MSLAESLHTHSFLRNSVDVGQAHSPNVIHFEKNSKIKFESLVRGHAGCAQVQLQAAAVRSLRLRRPPPLRLQELMFLLPQELVFRLPQEMTLRQGLARGRR